MTSLDPSTLFVPPLPSAAFPTKLNGASATPPQKPTRPTVSAQRIDLEPLYANLKAEIGEHWSEYKESVSGFITGQLNQDEFCLRTDHFLAEDSHIEHLHSQLVAGIFANSGRDAPDAGVAPWVSANDKPTVLSKPVSGDAVELRLKTEVMQLPARDRRRLKDVPEPEIRDPNLEQITEYHLAKQFRSSDAVPASAGGLNKTNWDLEIRKRYNAPLAAETGEFPDADAIQSRMLPICYEEALPNGCATSCAPFLATATEYFIKEVLSSIYSCTRVNMLGGSINTVLTHRFRKQLAKEEAAIAGAETKKEAGLVSLLPAEVQEALERKSLAMGDLRLAMQVGDNTLGQFPFVRARVLDGGWDGEYEAYEERRRSEEQRTREEAERERMRQEKVLSLERDIKMNGANGMDGANGVTVNGINGVDAHDDEEDEDWGWEGASANSRAQLASILDECLAVGM